MILRKLRTGVVSNPKGLKLYDNVELKGTVSAELDFGRKVRYTTTTNKAVINIKLTHSVEGFADKADVKEV